MDIQVNVDNQSVNVDIIQLQKMVFLYNALQEGWTIKKQNDCYIFKKNHEGKKEVYLDNYLKQFLSKNLNLEQILNN